MKLIYIYWLFNKCVLYSSLSTVYLCFNS